MTLNASGPISLGGSTAGQSINLELGQSATAQVSLNDTNVRTLAGVASGAIVMPTDFYGKSSVVIDFTNHSVNASAGGYSEAGYAVFGAGASIGTVQEQYNLNPYSFVQQWCTPTSQGGNYDVLYTYTGTAPTGPAPSTWHSTTGNPAWYIDVSGSGNSVTSQLTFQVRRTGTGTVLDTWVVDLSADAL